LVFFEKLKTNLRKKSFIGDGLWSYRGKIWFFWETWFFGRAFVLSEENLFLVELIVVLEDIWFFVRAWYFSRGLETDRRKIRMMWRA
jgi:hypothetical protein